MIKSGDLVIVVGNPLDILCAHVDRFLGLPLMVESVMHADVLSCGHCSRQWKNVDVAMFSGCPHALRVSWLKRIDAQSEPERVETNEEVTA